MKGQAQWIGVQCFTCYMLAVKYICLFQYINSIYMCVYIYATSCNLFLEWSTVRTVKWSVERKTSTAKQWPTLSYLSVNQGVRSPGPHKVGKKKKCSIVLLKYSKGTKTLVTSPKIKRTAKPPLHRHNKTLY